jgi:hypothetical protein
MVAAEAGLNLTDQLAEPGKNKPAENKVADPADELESRLAALRR